MLLYIGLLDSTNCTSSNINSLYIRLYTVQFGVHCRPGPLMSTKSADLNLSVEQNCASELLWLRDSHAYQVRAACGCRVGMCGYTAVPEDGRTCICCWMLGWWRWTFVLAARPCVFIQLVNRCASPNHWLETTATLCVSPLTESSKVHW